MEMIHRTLLLLALLALCQTALLRPGAPVPTRMANRRMPRTGGYQIVEQPSGQVFEYALNKVLKEHPQLSRDNLELVESQIVSGINYRFTFEGQNGEDEQYTTYVPLSQFPQNKKKEQPAVTTMALAPEPKKINKGESHYRSIRDQPHLYQDALQTLEKQNPWVKQYELIDAEECVNNKYEQRLILRKSKGQQVTFKVISEPQKETKIELEKYLHVVGYNPEEIDSISDDLRQKIPALNSFSLVEAWTSLKKKDTEGGQLVLKLQKENKAVTAFYFRHKNMPWTAVYGL